MWTTNLKVLAVALVVVGFYTIVAHVIPQVPSEVPEASSAITGAVTPEALVAAGERVFNGVGGCTACHGLGTRAPNLLTDFAGQGPIGARCGKRRPGMDCKAYIYQTLTDPSARYIVPGFENIMPDMRRQLTPEQIWSVIAFLESQGGEVTVTAADLAKTAGAGSKPGGASAAAPAGATLTATLDPRALIKEKGCIGCHSLEGTGAKIAPPFDGMGRRRTPDAIRRKILNPASDTVKGYEKLAGVMPKTFGQQLSAAQLEALVQFLASRK